MMNSNSKHPNGRGILLGPIAQQQLRQIHRDALRGSVHLARSSDTTLYEPGDEGKVKDVGEGAGERDGGHVDVGRAHEGYGAITDEGHLFNHLEADTSCSYNAGDFDPDADGYMSPASET